MKYLTVNEIRKLWIDFFENHNHYIVEPKSIVPVDDKSILFINSGVATLKKYFDGSETPPAKRLANIQKALRTNDIENVGVTSRHQTLFEMLGNFSIGDYFKSEAIELAYEFLTSDKYLQIDVDKLYFTVHPNDEIAYNKWIEMGIDANRIVKTDENFWEIGTGPGGPNSEIFYDRGEQYDDRDIIELLKYDLENNRVIEIWNLVFSEFNCEPGVKEREQYTPLPQQNIDTGMGLERVACISQNVETNFETDEFIQIINSLEKQTGLKYSDHIKPYRIISDHIRALSIAIADGALPSNDGRGYVLRRILRRAVKFAYMELNIEKPFLYKLVDEVVKVTGQFYSNLVTEQNYIKEVIQLEEQKFFDTINAGLKLFNEEIAKANNVFSGNAAFKLYDTFGFPIEITVELAEANNIKVDLEQFENQLKAQQERARNAQADASAMNMQNPYLKQIDVKSQFVGYDTLAASAEIVLITDLNTSFNSVDSGEYYIILDKTPFYAESGGQVGDQGLINSNKVVDTIKLPNGQHAHKVVVTEKLSVYDTVKASVDTVLRDMITKNHSATHLLHEGLHQIISKNAKQAGSLQDEHKTRFDFTSMKPLSNEEVRGVEAYVNEQISQAHKVIIENMNFEDTKKLNANALFGEKYGDVVRVVTMGDSIELCGGTHVDNTSEIEYFHILSETGIGSGIRRIEAITGNNVIVYHYNLVEEIEKFINESHEKNTNKQLISTTTLNSLLERAQNIVSIYDNGLKSLISELKLINENNDKLKKILANESSNNISELANELVNKVANKNEINTIDHEFTNIDVKQLREISDLIMNQLDKCILILKVKNDDKMSIIVRVSDIISSEYNANTIIKEIIEPHGGRGGGKPTMAQGGYQLS